MAAEIRLKRAYVDASPEDGARILVDRLWPRGKSKEKLQLTTWFKQIAPSDAVRDAFCHEVDKWPQFIKTYTAELNQSSVADEFVKLVRNELINGPVTLVYGAKDEEHNQAVVLRDWLKQKLV